MSISDVRIVSLPPMRVAAARARSNSPETAAWEKLKSWAEPRGLLDDPKAHPVYGFNNPPPEPGKSEYGYELWIQVDDSTGPSDAVEVRDYPGGRFAVTTCKLFGDPRGEVPLIWQWLLGWVKSNGYEWRQAHELEGVRDPNAAVEDVVLDLYLPIED